MADGGRSHWFTVRRHPPLASERRNGVGPGRSSPFRRAMGPLRARLGDVVPDDRHPVPDGRPDGIVHRWARDGVDMVLLVAAGDLVRVPAAERHPRPSTGRCPSVLVFAVVSRPRRRLVVDPQTPGHGSPVHPGGGGGRPGRAAAGGRAVLEWWSRPGRPSTSGLGLLVAAPCSRRARDFSRRIRSVTPPGRGCRRSAGRVRRRTRLPAGRLRFPSPARRAPCIRRSVDASACHRRPVETSGRRSVRAVTARPTAWRPPPPVSVPPGPPRRAARSRRCPIRRPGSGRAPGA